LNVTFSVDTSSNKNFFIRPHMQNPELTYRKWHHFAKYVEIHVC
jgi:hypothetical protein